MAISVILLRTAIVFCFCISALGQLDISPRHLPKSATYNQKHLKNTLLNKYGDMYSKITSGNNTNEVIKTSIIEKKQAASVKGFATQFIQVWVPTSGTVVNEECKNDSLIYLEQLENFTPWALQMLDATGKLPDGILVGNVHPLGDFSECLSVEAILNVTQVEPLFKGKYCYAVLFRQPNANQTNDGAEAKAQTIPVKITAELQMPAATNHGGDSNKGAFLPSIGGISADVLSRLLAEATPSIGFCIPSSCAQEDLQTALIHSLSPLNTKNYTYTALVLDGYCYTKEEVDSVDFQADDIAVMVLYCLLICMALVGTAVDVYQVYKPHLFSLEGSSPSLAWKVLKSFSVVSNGKKLLSTEHSAETLGCLHGLRFISMSWVILGHTWYTGSFLPLANPLDIVTMSEDWSMQVILNGTVSVDTFFLLSGLLVSYLMLKELSKKKKINPLLLYLHRYIRLTPAYALFLGLMATLIKYLGSGPFWHGVEMQSEFCKKNWWTNLLYINNFVHQSEACMGEMWYLACDMHLFLISPLAIYPLWRWRRLGLAWFASLTVVSFAIPGTLIYIHDYPPTSLVFNPNIEFQSDFYTKTYCRATPYFVGIFLGYILHLTRDTQLKIHKAFVTLAWLTAAAISLSIIYGLYDYNQAVVVPVSKTLSIFYGTFHRFAWSVCVSWVIFACIKGYGGFVNDILSCRLFMPLSRLTYCSYLIHLHVQIIFVSMLKFVIVYEKYLVVYFFLGHLVMTTIGAFLLSLLAEAPFINLEKILLGTEARTVKSPASSPPDTEKPKQLTAQEHKINASAVPVEGVCEHHGTYTNEGFVQDAEGEVKPNNQHHNGPASTTQYEILDGKNVPRTEL